MACSMTMFTCRAAATRPASRARPQGLDVAFDGGGHVLRAAGDVLPVLFRGGGHEVEDRADVLRGRGNVVQVRVLPPGGVDQQLQAKPLAHGVQRDGVNVVLRFQALKVGQRLAGHLREFGDACGGEILVLGFAARQSQGGRQRRIQADEGVGIGVRDGVDAGVRACGGAKCR